MELSEFMSSSNTNHGLTKCRQEMWFDFNSLAPRRSKRNFREVIFKLILVIYDWGISGEIVLTWTPQDLTDDKSTLVQVMALCRQATSHYLSQCWHSSPSPYRPQWVKCIIIKSIVVITFMGISSAIVFRWKALDLTDDKYWQHKTITLANANTDLLYYAITSP